MGRIRIKTIKSVGKKIIQMFPDKISSEFQQNKAKLPEMAQIGSKKLRNKIAGYLVALNKAKSMPKRPRVRPQESEKPREGGRERSRFGMRKRTSRR